MWRWSRKGSVRSEVWLASFGLALSLVLPIAAHAVDLKPKNFSLNVLGVPVEIPVTISFSAQSKGDGIVLQVHAQGNLKDIQDKALIIARGLPVPSDNCSHNGLNPVVNSIDSASITPTGKTVVVAIAGHVTAWACEHPLGATVKTIVGSDTVTLSAPIEIQVVDQGQIGVQLAGTVTATPQHALTAEVTNLLAVDINALMTTALAKALDASGARASLPALPGLVLTAREAQFSKDGTVLLADADGTAHMGNVAFNALLDLMSK